MHVSPETQERIVSAVAEAISPLLVDKEDADADAVATAATAAVRRVVDELAFESTTRLDRAG